MLEIIFSCPKYDQMCISLNIDDAKSIEDVITLALDALQVALKDRAGYHIHDMSFFDILIKEQESCPVYICSGH